METMKLFAVIRTHGDAWDDSLRLEEQPEWNAHAHFMNGLQKEGFIVFGGPLEGKPMYCLSFDQTGRRRFKSAFKAIPGPAGTSFG